MKQRNQHKGSKIEMGFCHDSESYLKPVDINRIIWNRRSYGVLRVRRSFPSFALVSGGLKSNPASAESGAKAGKAASNPQHSIASPIKEVK